MKGKIAYGYVWETGNKKAVNEDSLLLRTIKTKNGSLVVGCICDGMGGIGNGELASGYVAEQLEQWVLNECLPAIRRGGTAVVIKGKGMRFFKKVNKELFYHMKTKRFPLGTTASVLILYEKKGYIFHIGDSRIYGFFSYLFFKGISLSRQFTKDHRKKTNVLTRCLGLTPDGRVDFYQFQIPKGESGFLLCSDGFYRQFDKGLKKYLAPARLKSNAEIEKRLKEIVKRLIQKGERDNVSALYVKVWR
ncbi:MAG: serine/threonine-protein phosphatase [Lachnospiraceae bacterium]|nr:serine/threonine-protein phosphatase [Lachnospiraceae bacterium]